MGLVSLLDQNLYIERWLSNCVITPERVWVYASINFVHAEDVETVPYQCRDKVLRVVCAICFIYTLNKQI